MVSHDGENRSQRLLLALVMDTSSSMSGKPISLLNEALAGMAHELRNDVSLSGIAHVALVTFGHGGVTAWRGAQPATAGSTPFVPAHRFTAPALRAGGVTPLPAAIEQAMAGISQEKAELKRRHLQYYCPHLWVVSDGRPTDSSGEPSEDWRRLLPLIRDAEAKRRFALFTISAGDIDAVGDAVLREMAPGSHLRLNGFDFARALSLVSASAGSAARGHTVEEIKERVMRIADVQERVARVGAHR
jgi:uncharacterized protein YegL